MNTVTCRNCGANEGELHRDIGCDFEECPFCHAHFSSSACRCLHNELGLLDEKHGEDFAFLPREVYERGLSADQEKKVSEILSTKGRIPFGFPHMPNRWSGKGPSPASTILASCKKYIEDGNLTPIREGSNVFEGSPIKLANFGQVYLRLYPGFETRNMQGEATVSPPRFQFRFDPNVCQGKISVTNTSLGEAETTSLIVSASEAAEKVLAGDPIVNWSEIGCFKKGFSWHGLKKVPTTRFENYTEFLDRIDAELTVPQELL